jgi:hypothetical protein
VNRALTLLPGALVGIWCATSAAPAFGDASFAISRANLIVAVKTIGVMPIAIDRVVPDPDELAAKLEQNITARLQSGGFTVVPPSAMRAVRERGATALGGVYDPMTGIAIPGRLEALKEFSDNEYRTQHPVDAILVAEVVRRRAELKAGTAEWDGVRETVTSAPNFTAVLHALNSGDAHAMDGDALSLAVKLVDLHGKILYTGDGGLLTLEYATLDGVVMTYELAAVESQNSVAHPDVTARAMAVALDPLASGVVPTGPVAFTMPPPPQLLGTNTRRLRAFLRHRQRLALAPLEMTQSDLAASEPVRMRYSQLLGVKLAAVGFEMANGVDVEQLWAAERAASAGFFDPITGRLDNTKLAAARTRVLSTLRDRYKVSALVTPSIVSRVASFRQGFANWDGVTQPISGSGSWAFNGSIFNTDLKYAGRVDAFSLNLRIVDTADQALFEGVGGIELAQHLQRGVVVPVPETALFAKPDNDSKAIDVALHPLIVIQRENAD